MWREETFRVTSHFVRRAVWTSVRLGWWPFLQTKRLIVLTLRLSRIPGSCSGTRNVEAKGRFHTEAHRTSFSLNENAFQSNGLKASFHQTPGLRSRGIARDGGDAAKDATHPYGQ